MEPPPTLISAQVHFLDTELALIHIPLGLYTAFLQPILQVLLPANTTNLPGNASETTNGLDADNVRTRRREWAYDHPFVNVSITPVECSVACSRALADQLFARVLDTLDATARSQVHISEDNFVVVQVDGDGVEAGQRVLELTGPLAMNGISIFFITTYFSDYILVPARSRAAVVSALENRGFAFESEREAFVSISSPVQTPSLLSQQLQNHNLSNSRENSIHRQYPMSLEQNDSSFDPAVPTDLSLTAAPATLVQPTTPPSSVRELELRTFSLLKRREILPMVDPSIQLVQCAGRKDTTMRMSLVHPDVLDGVRGGNDSSFDGVSSTYSGGGGYGGGGGAGSGGLSTSATLTMRLHLGLVRCLISAPRPRFLSITMTDTEPTSLLLERRLLAEFDGPGEGGSGSEVLLGNKQEVLAPIIFDLRQLPVESTGIVCGVAGRLVGGTSRPTTGNGNGVVDGDALINDTTCKGPIEMSYLSTARAGTVMVAEVELERALHALSA